MLPIVALYGQNAVAGLIPFNCWLLKPVHGPQQSYNLDLSFSTLRTTGYGPSHLGQGKPLHPTKRRGSPESSTEWFQHLQPPRKNQTVSNQHHYYSHINHANPAKPATTPTECHHKAAIQPGAQPTAMPNQVDMEFLANSIQSQNTMFTPSTGYGSMPIML